MTWIPAWAEQVSWGTVPDWIAGVGTVAALLIAAFTYRSSVVDGRLRQARLTYSEIVDAKVVLKRTVVADGADAVIGDADLTIDATGKWVAASHSQWVTYQIVNNSDEPITGITVSLCVVSRATGKLRLLSLDAQSRDFLRPGCSIKFRALHTLDAVDDGGLVSAMTFRDSSGEYWLRTGFDTPELLSKNLDSRETERKLHFVNRVYHLGNPVRTIRPPAS